MLLHRHPRLLAPEEGVSRDDLKIVVVTDDTFAPEQYFDYVKLPRRVQVFVASAIPGNEGGHGSPQAVLESGRALRQHREFKNHDEFWLLVDTDHWTRGSHAANFAAFQKAAREEGFEVAVSNPCFDLWLLLHHDDITLGAVAFPNCAAVAVRFRELKGEFNKTRLNREHYNVELARVAHARARALTPDGNLYQPANPGTQVWRLVERALRLDG